MVCSHCSPLWLLIPLLAALFFEILRPDRDREHIILSPYNLTLNLGNHLRGIQQSGVHISPEAIQVPWRSAEKLTRIASI
jgi:hypothetical protein